MQTLTKKVASALLAACLIVLVDAPVLADGATLIPGTRTRLAIPSGFSIAEDFTGLVRRDIGASVLVAEIPTSARDMQTGLTEEALTSRGLSVLRRERMNVAFGEVVFIEATQLAQGIEMHKWIVVGGNAGNTIMLTANVPETLAPELGEMLRGVLLSAEWDPALTPDPGGAFAFRVQESADLKVSRNLGGALVLTPNGAKQLSSPLAPILVISRTTSPEAVSDLGAAARERLNATRTIDDVSIRDETTFDIAGMPAAEVTATATANNGQPVVVYQAAGFDGTHLVYVQAFVEPPLESRYLPQFREIARGLRPR